MMKDEPRGRVLERTAQYVAMFQDYLNTGEVDQAENLLEDMIVSHVVPPEEQMFIRLMQAHSQNGDLDRAEDVLIHMARARMVVRQPVYTILLQAYAEICDLE